MEFVASGQNREELPGETPKLILPQNKQGKDANIRVLISSSHFSHRDGKGVETAGRVAFGPL